MPYITNAKSSAIEIGQASQVMTSLLAADDWLSDSFLNEAGLKFVFLDNHLVGSLDWYRQERTQLSQSLGAVSVQGTRAQGAEAEIRAVLNQNFSVTLAADMQHTIADSPPNNFQYIPARTAGVSPQAGFGGAYVVYDFSPSGRAAMRTRWCRMRLSALMSLTPATKGIGARALAALM